MSCPLPSYSTSATSCSISEPCTSTKTARLAKSGVAKAPEASQQQCSRLQVISQVSHQRQRSWMSRPLPSYSTSATCCSINEPCTSTKTARLAKSGVAKAAEPSQQQCCQLPVISQVFHQHPLCHLCHRLPPKIRATFMGSILLPAKQILVSQSL